MDGVPQAIANVLLKRYITIDSIELENLLKILNLRDKEHIVSKEPKKNENLLKKITAMLMSQAVQSALHPGIEKALAFMHRNMHRNTIAH